MRNSVVLIKFKLFFLFRVCVCVNKGLEVKLPNSEKWQKVGHLGGAIFINAGELLSIWTNNLYPALVNLFIN